MQVEVRRRGAHVEVVAEVGHERLVQQRLLAQHRDERGATFGSSRSGAASLSSSVPRSNCSKATISPPGAARCSASFRVPQRLAHRAEAGDRPSEPGTGPGECGLERLGRRLREHHDRAVVFADEARNCGERLADLVPEDGQVSLAGRAGERDASRRGEVDAERAASRRERRGRRRIGGRAPRRAGAAHGELLLDPATAFRRSIATSSGAVVSAARLASVPMKPARGLASSSQRGASPARAASGATTACQPSASASWTAGPAALDRLPERRDPRVPAHKLGLAGRVRARRRWRP